VPAAIRPGRPNFALNALHCVAKVTGCFNGVFNVHDTTNDVCFEEPAATTGSATNV
jgi:hypothetical protein